MHSEEIQGGGSVKSSDTCKGSTKLFNICQWSDGLGATCENSSNLFVCASADNLKTKSTKAAPGGVCCGGGVLGGATAGTSVGAGACNDPATSLCSGDGSKLTV
jgi:hypothetical protein